MIEIDCLINSLFNLFTFTSITSYGVVKKNDQIMYEHIIGYYNHKKNFKFNFIVKDGNNLICEYNQEVFKGYKNINKNIINILLDFEIERIEEELINIETKILYEVEIYKFLSSKFPIDIILKIITIKK